MVIAFGKGEHWIVGPRNAKAVSFAYVCPAAIGSFVACGHVVNDNHILPTVGAWAAIVASGETPGDFSVLGAYDRGFMVTVQCRADADADFCACLAGGHAEVLPLVHVLRADTFVVSRAQCADYVFTIAVSYYGIFGFGISFCFSKRSRWMACTPRGISQTASSA